MVSNVAVALGCVLFLGGFAWAAVLYQPYTVPTDSMSPTVVGGQKVLAERISADEVRRGDVVVFQDATWGTAPEVKRIVGLGGDEVRCCDAEGRLTVNGKPVEEPYLDGGVMTTEQHFSTRVEKGRLFLLGDNRGISIDSADRLTEQAQGSVPVSAVKGRVDATAWPLGGAGMLPRPSGFAELPGGVSSPGPLEPLVWAIMAGALLILAGAAYGPVARKVGGSRG
ncbi:hypothetical protein SRB5_23790 [Streptomyces sp. RB5]|uniref:Signal peptidase I n=1 Tax=Streptomyces smaragdinus TaxID=2585196 RepID=A0A7K0CFS6_9ACTN|nr:hypothetical protein [Streptomyces smaragdinus]